MKLNLYFCEKNIKKLKVILCVLCLKLAQVHWTFKKKNYNVLYKQIYFEIVVNFNRKIVFYFIYFIDREITKIHFHTMTLLYVKGIF